MKVLTKERMEEIYRRNCDMIYRVCLLQLKHEQDALDAVSETFVRLFQKKPDFADTEHEKAWLIRTAINYCKDVQKSFWKRKRNAYDAAAEQMLQSVQTPSEDREVLRRYGDYLLHMRNFYICIIMRDTVLRRLQ